MCVASLLKLYKKGGKEREKEALLMDVNIYCIRLHISAQLSQLLVLDSGSGCLPSDNQFAVRKEKKNDETIAKSI